MTTARLQRFRYTTMLLTGTVLVCLCLYVWHRTSTLDPAATLLPSVTSQAEIPDRDNATDLVRPSPDFSASLDSLHSWTLMVLIVLLASIATLSLLNQRSVRIGSRSALTNRELQLLDTIRDLTDQRDRALAASEAKSQFLADMSHEIRTPMTGILGTADLFAETELTEVQREYLQTLRNSGLMLIRLTNTVLEYSRAEAGFISLDVQSFSLGDTLADVLRLYAAEASRNGLDLVTDVDPSVPDRLLGDKVRLAEIFSNLISNAIRFSESGTIRLSCRPGENEPAATDGIELMFVVSDPGVGIPEDAQANLFERFTQAESPGGRPAGGSGLGLAICRELATLMDGRIGVRSRVGKGSEFWFTARFGLPTAANQPLDTTGHDDLASPSSQAQRTMAAFDGRVLAVDDDPVNQLVARRMLEHLGFDVEVAADGDAALEAARSREFDCILIDNQLPGVSGQEVIRRIRHAEGADRHTPIVSFTACTSDRDRQAMLAAGADGHLTKPMTLACLAVMLDRVGCGSRESDAPEPTRPDPAADDHASPPHAVEQDSDPAGAAVLDQRVVDDLIAIELPDGSSLLARLTACFREQASGQLEQIKDAAARDDRSRLRQLAHKYLGSSRQLGASRLSRIGVELARVDDDTMDHQIIRQVASLQFETEVALRALDQHLATEALFRSKVATNG